MEIVDNPDQGWAMVPPIYSNTLSGGVTIGNKYLRPKEKLLYKTDLEDLKKT